MIYISGGFSGIVSELPTLGSLAEFLRARERLSTRFDPSRDHLICFEYSREAIALIRKHGLSPNACTLIRGEPHVVQPKNFAESTLRLFGTVITLGGNALEDNGAVYWPMEWPTSLEIMRNFAKPKSEGIVLLNSNKISFVRGELYSLRRQSIRVIKDLELYGHGWDLSLIARSADLMKALAFAIMNGKVPQPQSTSNWFAKHRSYHGPVDNKYEVMSRYKYALVIENSSTYVSEKLVDAIIAGCIPIYVGPSLSGYGIPGSIVVEASPDVSSIANAFHEAKSLDYRLWKLEAGEFLADPKTLSNWDRGQVYSRILDIIDLQTDV